MAAKPIPEYMQRYMENIGHECFTDYQQLSRERTETIQVYHELKMPSKIAVGGRFAPRFDVQGDLYRIEEQFKDKAVDMACKKYGYKDPGYENYDRAFTEQQENVTYASFSRDNFDRTAEDIRAEKAHARFEKENPDKIADRQSNREVIEFYFGGREARMEPAKESPGKEAEQKEKEQKKEQFSREDLFKGYVANQNEMTTPEKKFSMSDRFLMTLSSERGKPQEPSDPERDMEKDKDDVEMERDI